MLVSKCAVLLSEGQHQLQVEWPSQIWITLKYCARRITHTQLQIFYMITNCQQGILVSKAKGCTFFICREVKSINHFFIFCWNHWSLLKWLNVCFLCVKSNGFHRTTDNISMWHSLVLFYSAFKIMKEGLCVCARWRWPWTHGCSGTRPFLDNRRQCCQISCDITPGPQPAIRLWQYPPHPKTALHIL